MQDQELKKSEVAVQDKAASFYEDTRYALPAARAYYDWFFKKLFALSHPRGLILDNGCGVGILSRYLPDGEIVGVDLSPEMVRLAGRRMKDVRVADSQNLPFVDNTFDTVVSLSLLHHLPDPARGVSEIARVLKPGGVAIFEDVVSTAVSALPRFFLNRFSSHFSHEHKNFGKSELLTLLGADLQIERIQHYGYLAYALLGFPDVINFERYLPFKRFTVPGLLTIDDFLEKLPLLNRQSWNIIIITRKKGQTRVSEIQQS